ncbi:MAG: DUF2652 domain-containing protein [Reichenbachiella sp.]
MPNKSFFFIPDISGFTSFVKNVEIEHSRHIISELLELIIDADELGLTMVEVEGDAIFFFKHNDIPDRAAILSQVEKTYIKFHEHLKLYETNRICQCGACSSASELSLKFVADVGVAEMITVKGNQKPFGESVIRVHRLLKNNVASNEYLLYTNDLNDFTSLEKMNGSWPESLEDSIQFEGIGSVDFKSINLNFLESKITKPEPLKPRKLTNNPYIMEMEISARREHVYEFLTNMDQRPKWSQDVTLFKYKKGQVNQVGYKHVCVLDKGSVEFETVTNDFGPDKLVYGETTNEIPIFKEATTYFVLSEHDYNTLLRIEVHFDPIPIISWILKGVVMKKLKAGLSKNLSVLKAHLEKQAEEEVLEDVKYDVA